MEVIFRRISYKKRKVYIVGILKIVMKNDAKGGENEN